MSSVEVTITYKDKSYSIVFENAFVNKVSGVPTQDIAAALRQSEGFKDMFPAKDRLPASMKFASQLRKQANIPPPPKRERTSTARKTIPEHLKSIYAQYKRARTAVRTKFIEDHPELAPYISKGNPQTREKKQVAKQYRQQLKADPVKYDAFKKKSNERAKERRAKAPKMEELKQTDPAKYNKLKEKSQKNYAEAKKKLEAALENLRQYRPSEYTRYLELKQRGKKTPEQLDELKRIIKLAKALAKGAPPPLEGRKTIPPIRKSGPVKRAKTIVDEDDMEQ